MIPLASDWIKDDAWNIIIILPLLLLQCLLDLVKSLKDLPLLCLETQILLVSPPEVVGRRVQGNPNTNMLLMKAARRRP
jgi:hypothetical protein